MDQLKFIEKELAPLRAKLNNHPLYSNLKTIGDIKIFMEQHVFAVWDFMSLLKALQNRLTCTSTPWVPAATPSTARFINEIVLGEESDIDELGQPKSHFEMYLEAMEQVGANTKQITKFIGLIKTGQTPFNAALEVELDNNTLQFINFTFDVIKTQKTHLIAAAFTFGREDLIPDMFFQIINQSKTKSNTYSKLSYYLNRHIELDGDEHGPLSLKMITELCKNNKQNWQEVLAISKLALKHRIALWDNISKLIEEQKTVRPNPFEKTF